MIKMEPKILKNIFFQGFAMRFYGFFIFVLTFLIRDFFKEMGMLS